MLTVPSLRGSLNVSVTDEHLRRLEIIDSEDYSGVIRKVEEFIGKQSRDYLLRGVYALKQYYAVALLDPANAHAISSRVDPFWHAHILHTEQYTNFCKGVVGEYMHHIPLNEEHPEQMGNIATLYDYTIEILHRVFRSVDTEMWLDGSADGALICLHKGNIELYPEVQELRLFEPVPRGLSYAFG